jgi:hypothetical protein
VEEILSSEMPADNYQTKRRHIPEDMLPLVVGVRTSVVHLHLNLNDKH